MQLFVNLYWYSVNVCLLCFIYIIQHCAEKPNRLRGANLLQTAILNFGDSHFLCLSYFCRIARCGEDILNLHELIRLEDFQYRGFDLGL